MPENRTKIRRRLLIALGVTILLIVLWIAIVAIRGPKYIEPDTSDWQTAQIFFSVGDSWKSVAVRSFTSARDFALADSTPSHCGIILRQTDGILLIHESTTAGHIVAEKPKEYLEKNGSYCLYALPAPCPIDTVRLKKDIKELLQQKKPFDFNFDHNDTMSLYCSELVVTLLEKNGCAALSDLRDRTYIYPQDLLNRCREASEP